MTRPLCEASAIPKAGRPKAARCSAVPMPRSRALPRRSRRCPPPPAPTCGGRACAHTAGARPGHPNAVGPQGGRTGAVRKPPTSPARSGPQPASNSPSTDRSGVRGSSSWKFTCTGPARYRHPREATASPSPPRPGASAPGPNAARHASRAAWRAKARSAGPAAGSGICRKQRTWSPYAFTWSTVCGAPSPCNRKGRSPESTTSGTRDVSASSTAG